MKLSHTFDCVDSTPERKLAVIATRAFAIAHTASIAARTVLVEVQAINRTARPTLALVIVSALG